MKYFRFFTMTLILILFTGVNLFAQMDAVLPDGRMIVVYNDGTWRNKPVPFKDTRDNKVYETILIGTQTWFAENLAYKTQSGCWAYNNIDSNVEKYGYLYNWTTAKDACPTGWHLPTMNEVDTLVAYLGGSGGAGLRLKDTSTFAWSVKSADARNVAGYSCVGAGYRTTNGEFTGLGLYSYQWIDKEYEQNDAMYIHVNNNSSAIIIDNNPKTTGYSVRCIKDN